MYVYRWVLLHVGMRHAFSARSAHRAHVHEDHFGTLDESEQRSDGSTVYKRADGIANRQSNHCANKRTDDKCADCGADGVANKTRLQRR